MANATGTPGQGVPGRPGGGPAIGRATPPRPAGPPPDPAPPRTGTAPPPVQARATGAASDPARATGAPRPPVQPRAAGAAPDPALPRASGSASVPAAPGRAPVPAARRPDGEGWAAQPVAPAPRVRRRKRAWLAALAAALVLAALGAGAAVQLRRALPPAHLVTTIAATLQIPGAAPRLPWPSTGSAELLVDGLGRLGGSRSATAAPIGSVAKVMTAYLILQDHPLAAGEPGPAMTVTAADVADFRARIPSGQSLVPVAAGEKLTERDALEALLLPSANNVARMLAVWDAGSEPAFVEKMNAVARDLGLAGSRYTDPSGFLPSTVSTAADQVVLARAAMRLPVFAEIVALRSASIPVAGTIRNYNDLLGVDGIVGIKTGSTTQAGGNLVFAARLTVAGRPVTLVGAVFNQPGTGTTAQLARVSAAVRKILAAARAVVREYPILSTEPVGRVTTAWGATASVSPATPLRVVGWPGLAVPVRVDTLTPGAEVTPGQVVGSVEARPGSGVRVELRADGRTADPSPWWRLTRH